MRKIEDFKRYFYAISVIILCALGYILFIYVIKSHSNNLIIVGLQKLIQLLLLIILYLPIIFLILFLGTLTTDYFFPNKFQRNKILKNLLIIMFGALVCFLWAVGPGIVWVFGEELLSKFVNLF
jgi:hypothetical protein